MLFFNIPSDKFTDFQERARFIFIWRITYVFLFVIGGLTIVTAINDARYTNYYLGVTFLVLFSLFFLYRTYRFRLVSIFLFLGISAITISALFNFNDGLHFQEGIWMIVIALASFFTLGNKWGMFYLTVNLVSYVIYYNYRVDTNLFSSEVMTPSYYFMLSIEFVVSMLLICFVMYEYSLVNSLAIKNMSEAYKGLKEEKLLVEKQNREKTILLQEIHHRVKNNLQVVVSLLRIQSKDLKSAEAKESFQDAITRILTMSLIHQKLYEKESLVNIDIKDYLETLVGKLIETNSTLSQIKYTINSSLNSVSANSIVPLGLIINELVVNSLKHAFTSTGEINLTLSEDPNNPKGFQMVYIDNGEWKESESVSFGIELIAVFTEQLNGSYTRETTEKGTFYHFQFSEE